MQSPPICLIPTSKLTRVRSDGFSNRRTATLPSMTRGVEPSFMVRALRTICPISSDSRSASQRKSLPFIRSPLSLDSGLYLKPHIPDEPKCGGEDLVSYSSSDSTRRVALSGNTCRPQTTGSGEAGPTSLDDVPRYVGGTPYAASTPPQHDCQTAEFQALACLGTG